MNSYLISYLIKISDEFFGAKFVRKGIYAWKHQRTNHCRSIQQLMQLNYKMKTK